MERRYIFVHTHPENLIIGPLEAQQFGALPLALLPPIESRLFSLQADLFRDPAVVAALADPEIEVICLCLRCSDRYSEAKARGMTVIEVTDTHEAFSRAKDLLPRIEDRVIPEDEFGPARRNITTYWEPRADAADWGAA